MELLIYVAITGTAHYFGTGFLKPGQVVYLRKDPDNPHDQEAIKAVMSPIGKIGYVANSTHTVPKGCRSAGRIYDSFDQQISGIVRFVIKDTVIVELAPNLEEFYLIKMSEDAANHLR
ncbi:HIRAN domain-containing protein [Paenibacillus sp. NEAU-GSW1]|uniref:HIRAN domain-containing protein n=1 Tax=Paenibacillus sp. NEAU-GSW1 TaxID=2682486 RepID=UPI0012E3221C|nr:HIRAN domain-containing protein [Paenibacillus sp. NEAU-GSW1]MUT65659.1 DNA-binding protein [Paenibacillus sp. NEAU-GSW1]